MLDQLFRGLFDSSTQTVISIIDFLLCLGVSVLIGFFLAFAYSFRNQHTKSFVVTLALIPAVVCVVIMLVNGNLGAGVAVAGAFSLVRFRSVPGTAREIGAIFLAMAAGLATGMGYPCLGILLALILGMLFMLYNGTGFGERRQEKLDKTLHITIPEDLDYTGVFDDLLKTYTSQYEILGVKTTNMGSLFKLTYRITLQDAAKEKEFIDKLRCRNGNLEISIVKQETNLYEL